MDHTATPKPISIRPIDTSSLDAAGAPGTPARVAVFTALDILSRSPCYQHRGRGPDAYDWLGLVLEVVGDTLTACAGNDEPLDDFLIYSADWERGPSVDAARVLFTERWGLKEITVAESKPGDILLFAMPTAVAGIRLPDRTQGKDTSVGTMAYVGWATPPRTAWLEGRWVDNAVSAFTWPDQ